MNTALRRFNHVKEANPADVVGLAPDHPAMTDMRTMFPSTVKDVSEVPNILVSGHNNRKIGKTVMKGPWEGMPIYTLTLEERATCPKSCHMLSKCLVPGTRVLTADLHWTPIELLAVGQEIVGFDEHRRDGRGRLTKPAVVERLGRARLPCMRITTDQGVVTASADHLWLARQKLSTVAGRRRGFDWVASRDIAVGARIAFIAKPWEADTSYDAARLRGFVEGEGSVTTSHATKDQAKSRVCWSQRPGRLNTEILETATRLGFSVVQRPAKSGVNSSDVVLSDLRGGWRACLEFLGRIRPTRLLDKVQGVFEKHSIDAQGAKSAVVLAVEDVGEQEVVTIQTSTATLIAEGLCSHNCYGNAMHMARRIRHGEEFEALLRAELIDLQDEHPKGFVVRLHVLGDFYSTHYAAKWLTWLHEFPALHIFGYTARRVQEEPLLMKVVMQMNTQFSERCVIRFSTKQSQWCGATVIDRMPEGPVVPEGTVCPAETSATECCATCGLCWSPAMRNKTIVFVAHGLGATESKAAAHEVNLKVVSGLRPVDPISLLGKSPKEAEGKILGFREVDPRLLSVDETYQRRMSAKGARLIRTIADEWSWRKFTPPTVVEVEGGRYHVIDGQHTAIAAASRGDIKTVWVKVIDADAIEDRADTFVGMNRDRLVVSNPDVFYAEIAAKDEIALSIKGMCDRAGVIVLRQPPAGNRFGVGETLSIMTLRRLHKSRGATRGEAVLKACVQAGLAPIKDWAIEAFSLLMFGPKPNLTAQQIITTIRALGPDLTVKAHMHIAKTGGRLREAYAHVIRNHAS